MARIKRSFSNELGSKSTCSAVAADALSVLMISAILVSAMLSVRGSAYAGDQAYFYRVKEKDSLSSVLFHLGIKPIYGKNGRLELTISLNPRVSESRGDKVYPGDVIHLPVLDEKTLREVAIVLPTGEVLYKTGSPVQILSRSERPKPRSKVATNVPPASPEPGSNRSPAEVQSLARPLKTRVSRRPASFQETPDPFVEAKASSLMEDLAVPLPETANRLEDPAPNRERESEERSKLALDLGAGLTYLSYREKINQTQFKLSEAGLTVKAGAGYALSSKFELGGNGFITAVPVKLGGEPDALQAARFYGVNGRVGYLVGEINPRAKIYVFLGYYLWGTVIPAPRSPNLNYGVSLLSGPQVFLTGRFQTEEGRKFSGYVKAAAMANGSNLSLTNRELALGGSYEIGQLARAWSHTWFLGLDYANAQYAAPHQSFELNSLSLGITMGF